MIKNIEPLSMAEATDYLKDPEGKEAEIRGFIKKFTKMKPEKAKEIRKKINALDLMKVREEHISSIIDMVPEKIEDLNKIFKETSLDEDEANKIMATHDPIAAMANADAEKLGSLIDGIETQNDAITEMLDALAKETGARLPEFEPVDEASQGRLDQKAKAICPHCGGEFTIK